MITSLVLDLPRFSFVLLLHFFALGIVGGAVGQEDIDVTFAEHFDTLFIACWYSVDGGSNLPAVEDERQPFESSCIAIEADKPYVL